MSREIGEYPDKGLPNMGGLQSPEMSITAFWGGEEYGTCYQFTIGGKFVQLTAHEAAWMAHELTGDIIQDSLIQP